MDRVPDKIVEKIFKSLSKVDRLCSVCFVNKRFKRIAGRFYDSNFSLGEFEIPRGNSAEIARKVHHLLKILFKKKGIGWELERIDLSFPRDRTGRIFDKSFELIRKRAKKLESIEIRNSEISAIAIGILANFQSGLKFVELADLRLSGSTGADFAKIFQRNEKTLRIFVSRIPTENFFISTPMKFLDQLTLSFSNWSPEAVAAIARQCPNLATFTLESASHGPFHLGIDQLANLEKLEFLTLKFGRCVAIEGLAVDLQEVALQCEFLRAIEIQGILVINGEFARDPLRIFGNFSQIREISVEFESSDDLQLFVECVPEFAWYQIRSLGFRIGEIDPMMDLSVELWHQIVTYFGSTLESLHINVQQPATDADFGPPNAVEFRSSGGFNWNFDFFHLIPNLVALKIDVDGAPSRSGRRGTLRYRKLVWPFSRGFLQAIAHACRRLEKLDLQGKFDKEAFDAFVGFREHFCDNDQIALKLDQRSAARIKELYGDDVEAVKTKDSLDTSPDSDADPSDESSEGEDADPNDKSSDDEDTSADSENESSEDDDNDSDDDSSESQPTNKGLEAETS